MKLLMAGADFRKTPIGLREKLHLSPIQSARLIRKLVSSGCAEGGVIVSTCNRTEVYVNERNCLDAGKILAILGDTVGIPVEILEKHCYIKRSTAVIKYLFELTCGLHSMILGEDQIITQISDAISTSTEDGLSSPLLNSVFRRAIACARESKTVVNLKNVSPSIVDGAVGIVDHYVQSRSRTNVLVIGNGEIGRMAAGRFYELGCDVAITTRRYKYADVRIPPHCTPIPYGQRYEKLPESDIVISATKSPHHTITQDGMAHIEKVPDYFFDLAVPRDIDPNTIERLGLRYFDVDRIGRNHVACDMEQLDSVNKIIDKHYEKFDKWFYYHEKAKIGALAK